jgi:hypothetical protein
MLIATPLAAAFDAVVVAVAAAVLELAGVVVVELALEPQAATATAVTSPSSITLNRWRDVRGVMCRVICESPEVRVSIDPSTEPVTF